jgi:hypothetical protein
VPGGGVCQSSGAPHRRPGHPQRAPPVIAGRAAVPRATDPARVARVARQPMSRSNWTSTKARL